MALASALSIAGGCSSTNSLSSKPFSLVGRSQGYSALTPGTQQNCVQVAVTSPVPDRTAPGRTAPGRTVSSQVVTVSAETNLGAHDVRPASAENSSCSACGSAHACGPCGDCAATCGPSCEATCETTRWDVDPAEFICDGGDRQPHVAVRENWSVAGVNTTDTVIYYETLGGKVCVQPSNRTCIYSPRFGAVRQVTGAALASSTLAPGRLHKPQATADVLDRSAASRMELAAKPVGQKQVLLLDRIHDQQRGVNIERVVPPTPVAGIVSPKVNADRTLVDNMLNTEWLALIERKIEIVTLINPEAISVELGQQEAVFVSDAKRAAEVYVYETPDKCSMRLTKTASHQMASPGDRIRFTIRFENLGTQKLGNAVIVDSLSPRLSYVDGSQHCSVEADFSIEPNDVGSSLLRWSVKSPIEGQQGGVISFDCLVR